MSKTPLREVRQYVKDRREFKGNNCHGLWVGRMYVVYSYGDHWPMFLYDSQCREWFENEEKYSVTTSKHRSSAHPHCDTKLRSCKWMKDCINHGGEGMLEQERLLASFPMV